jgi:hypothetical protein
VVHQHQKAGIETPLLTHQHGINTGLEVIVDTPFSDTAPVVKGSIMGRKYHFLCLPWEGDYEGHATIGESKMGQLDTLHNTPQLNLLLTPVELIGIT